MAVQQVCRTRGVGEYLASERHIMWWHRLDPLTPNAKTGVVIIHGAGADADYFLTDPLSNPIAPTIVSTNRMPAIATDAGGNLTWGNSTAQTAMDATMTYFTSQLGAKDQVILLGQSMGGTTVLNWARNNPSKVAAIVLHLPIVDLQDIVDNNRGPGLGPTVPPAYGNPLGDVIPPAFNPAANTADYVGMPIRIWYSTNDLSCDPGVVAAFGTAVGATMTSLGAVGHSITGIDYDDMAAWIAQFI
jgi:pimeloyl-ACP methyl ester carboxylesterase